jgi:hypothetical protein
MFWIHQNVFMFYKTWEVLSVVVHSCAQLYLSIWEAEAGGPPLELRDVRPAWATQ